MAGPPPPFIETSENLGMNAGRIVGIAMVAFFVALVSLMILMVVAGMLFGEHVPPPTDSSFATAIREVTIAAEETERARTVTPE